MEGQKSAWEAKAGGGGNCVFGALLQGRLEGRSQRRQGAAGDQLSSRASSEDRPRVGRRPAQGGAAVGGGLRARPSWLWALGRPFHLLSLCLLWEDRKSPPFPAGLRS